MKIRKKIILFLTTILSFSNVMPSRKVSADVNPYALIQTVNDETSANPNNSFEQAHSKTVGSLTQPTSYSGNIEGLISSSTDVDYFKFNVYANSTITFVLSMINSDMEDMYEYTISVYKHDNKVDVDADDITLLGTTSQPGTYDMYYNNNIIPGVYYVKVFSAVGDYSTRFSYRLNYSISFETKNTINIEEYALENPNSYLVWTSDFNVCEEKFLRNKRGEFYCYTPEYTYPNDFIEEIWSVQQFLNFEIYLWGTQIRTEIFQKVNSIYEMLITIKSNWIEEIERGGRVDQFITISDSTISITCNIIGLFGSLLDTVTNNISLGSTFLSNFVSMFLIPNTTYDFDKINMRILYYSILKNALATGVGTSETEIICISHISKLVHQLYQTHLSLCTYTDFDNVSSKYVDMCKYNHTYIYEIKEFSNNGGETYFPIYGKIYDNLDMENIF